MKNSSKILIAFGAGVAIGGLLGILFAPNNGCETRKKISDTGKKITDAVKDTVNKCQGKCSNMKEEVKGKMQTVTDKMEEFA